LPRAGPESGSTTSVLFPTSEPPDSTPRPAGTSRVVSWSVGYGQSSVLGRSLTAFTFMVKVLVTLVSAPPSSLALAVMAAVPEALAAGV
jgi:hypothetical protein